jgi:hypothetical protein
MLAALVALAGMFVALYLTLYKLGYIGTLACAVGSCETVHPRGLFFTSEVRRPGGGLYALTKRLQEEMCRSFHDAYGMRIIVLRPDYIVDSRLGLGRHHRSRRRQPPLRRRKGERTDEFGEGNRHGPGFRNTTRGDAARRSAPLPTASKHPSSDCRHPAARRKLENQ